MLKLIRPESKYISSIEGLELEYINDTGQIIRPMQKLLETIQSGDFKGYFEKLLEEEKGINLKPGYVKQTTFWLMDDDKYIGIVALRHSLTPLLEITGGHIAYEIRPTERRKGYAKSALKLCLDEAKKIGIKEVLVTCQEQNTASHSVMKSVMCEIGGVDASDTESEGHINKRFWIRTEKRKNKYI